jgi:hypothetical protein
MMIQKLFLSFLLLSVVSPFSTSPRPIARFDCYGYRVEIQAAGRDLETHDLVVLLRGYKDGETVFTEANPFIFHNAPSDLVLETLVADTLRVAAPAPGFFASLTVFPDSGKPGTTSVDGDVGTNSNVSWSGARSTADCVDCSSSGTITAEGSVGVITGTPLYSVIRALINFDTSSLGAGATISAATLSVKPQGSHVDFATGDFVRLVPNTISSNVNYTTSDFGSIGTTALASDASIASMSTGTYVDYSLNATGLSQISVTGVSHFGLRTGHDVNNTTPVPGTDPSFPNSGGSLVFFDSADQAGTGSDPKLVITFTPGAGRKRIIHIGGL